MNVGYLGPSGTFTEMATLNYFRKCMTTPYDSIEDVIYAVDNKEISFGVVPIENTTEGAVNVTLDMLIFDVSLSIVGEIILPINHFLLVKEKFLHNKIDEIISHPQALAQCRNYLYKKYPDAIKRTANSTTLAAKIVADSDTPIASISTRLAAEIYGLCILDKNIQDEKKNETKFIIISKEEEIERNQPLNNFKTSIAFASLDKPGELYKILAIFNQWVTKLLQ